MMLFIEVSPSLLIFISLSFVGTLFVVLSVSIIGVWVGLECNFFGYIPVLNSSTSEESESAMKYFITQGLGSSVVFLGVLLVMGGRGGYLSVSVVEGGLIFLVIGMLIKVGVFPFHFWFPSVMGGSSWFNCFMLSTWQKLGVFYFFSGMSVCGILGFFLMGSGVVTSVIGGLGGVGQVYFRSIASYSSLVHSGWMISLCLVSEKIFFLYYLVYMSIIFYFFRMMNYFQGVSLVGVSNSFSNLYKNSWVWVFAMLFSLSGLPPLLGSGLKLMGILTLFNGSLMVLAVLVLSSIFGLFYYLSVLFSSSLTFNFCLFLEGLEENKLKESIFKSSFFLLIFNVGFGFVLFIFMASVFF